MKPLVYVILGASGSGRRALVRDLVAYGLTPDERAVIYVSSGETPPAGEEAVEAWPAHAEVRSWNWEPGRIAAETPGEGVSHVFFLTDGRSNPVDQIEAFKPWLSDVGGELARVFTVVDCRLASKNPELLAWYEACIHFSDVVLLTKRAGVENKWVSDFQGHFRSQFYPCFFEIVRDHQVKNPALVLDPQPRRISQYFDAEPLLLGEMEELEIDEEADGEGVDSEEAGETAAAAVDPYLARRIGGRRVKEIPAIAPYLET